MKNGDTKAVMDMLLDIKNKEDLKDFSKQVNNLIRSRWDMLNRADAEKFYVGQTVQFTSSKRGEVITGTISRINAKTISLDCKDKNGFPTSWRVSPSYLKAV